MKYCSLLFSFLLFLSPWTAAGKELPKVAVWDLAPGNIPAPHTQDLTLILVSEIVKLKKYEVYSQENVRAIAGWNEERIKLGCTDSKCLLALGQLDISKLISGRVGKIGNTYSVSLNLFDTQNARAENAVSEFCRTEDDLIILVQKAVRNLLAGQGESAAPIGPPADRSAVPLTSLAVASQPSAPGEAGLIGRIFYFENCYIGTDRFDSFVKFQPGGKLEVAPRGQGGPEKPGREPKNFTPLNGRWVLEKNMVLVDIDFIRGFPPRRVMRMEINLEKKEKGAFPVGVEFSTDGGGPRFQTWDGTLERKSCSLEEFQLP